MHEINWKDPIYKLAGKFIRQMPQISFARTFFKSHITIIYYHGVWNDDRLNIFDGITTKEFAEQVGQAEKIFQYRDIG